MGGGGGHSELADDLSRSLDELTGRCRELVLELCAELLAAAGERARAAVSGPAVGLVDEVLDPQMRSFVLALSNDVYEDDHDWMASVATVLAGKAPSEWTDRDLAAVRARLPQKLAAFNRLRALHAERRAADGLPFEALRVSVTDPSGTEEARLVGVAHDERSTVEPAVDDLIAKIAEAVGSSQRAHHAVLAVLAERLLAPSGVEPAEADPPGARVADGGP